MVPNWAFLLIIAAAIVMIAVFELAIFYLIYQAMIAWRNSKTNQHRRS